jgi:hypothetical protein
LIGERAIRRVAPARTGAVGRVVAIVVTFVLVTVAWVFFRATSFSQAFAIVKAMCFAIGPKHTIPMVDVRVVAVITGCLLAVHYWMRERSLEDLVGRVPWFGRAVALSAMLVAIIIMQGEDRAFIYFQF